ncbi:cyclic nucleotide-binding domain-containing protein [Beggiatoa leptomitoformis]|uniref:Cyclic nucleotide-binding domain-containing protein n=1 Tax=Beggiatoa leptomitoformis TaxID=288004 RepID=A0A2N9YAL6_9GAMM|nr:cyclic nucleotide-binding domain-containing protein [Beggiatoa leptomitoformis]ALG67101.1 cyclic nucleotide-binding domain-containing protein [Beggiatoa leptomitoformis]AUI67506.1 cyclic nucleotide-binding domain-containing protein [Beggiatoa leptomitoformis]
MSKENFAVLSVCPLFNGLSKKQIFYITAFFKQALFSKGAIVMQEGQKVDQLYIVSHGKWEVFLPKDNQDIPREQEVRLGMLECGALIGEYSFIDEYFASASVRTLEKGGLLMINRPDFERILESSNQVGKIIYKNLLLGLISRLRKQNEEKELLNLFDF